MDKKMMDQMGLRTALVFSMAIGLTACGEKVDCNSGAVKKDAIEIIQSHLNGAQWYNEMKLAITGEPALENIKTVESDKDGKRAQCIGTYTFTYNEKPRSVDVAYDLAYLEDKKKAEVKVAVTDVQGGLMGLVMSERPIKNGEEKIYDNFNGNIIAIHHWKQGRQDGTQESFDRVSKALVHQYSAIDGQKEGAEKAWGPDGKLMIDLIWKDGKATGFATTDGNGKIQFSDGLGYIVTQFLDGKKEGPQKSYATSHQGQYLERIVNFKDDQRDGITQQFDEKGSIIFEVLYRKGTLVLDDAATAHALDTCVAGWEVDYRKTLSGLYSPAEETNARIKYKRPEWESDCKGGKLPPRG